MSNYYSEHTIIFRDGQFIRPHQSKVNSYSQSIHYGNGVFEGIRSYDTKSGVNIFRAKEHFERLKYGAKVMGIKFDYTIEELIDITYKLLEKNKLKDAYIRPLIVLGEDMGLLTPNTSSLIIQCWKWGKLMGDDLLNIKTSKFQRPNPKSCFIDAKITGHYVNSILAKNNAKQNGFDEALLLDIDNNVAECSGANIFIQNNNTLSTPIEGHIMPGITRNVIIELCESIGVKVEKRTISPQELKQSESAFITGTAAEVVGIKRIDDYHFPLKWESSLGFKLMNLYKKEILGEGILEAKLV